MYFKPVFVLFIVIHIGYVLVSIAIVKVLREKREAIHMYIP